MKAVVCTRYGGPDVLRLTDVDTPAPGNGQVLVKVHAVSLNASDWEMPRGKPLYARIGGPFRPRHHVLGSDIAGRVAATGRNATRFRPGDDVFATSSVLWAGSRSTCACRRPRWRRFRSA